jgi:hypothetical protein
LATRRVQAQIDRALRDRARQTSLQ